MMSRMTASSPPSQGRVVLQTMDARLPLHARLREILESRVRGGERKPPAPLPAEAELASHYEVSLGTVRRVLAELVDEGLLERRQGSGTYLRRARMNHS